MAIAEDLKQLKDKTDERGVLTIYLNTDIRAQSQNRGEWKIRLKNGIKRLEEYAEKSSGEAEFKALKKLLKQADKHIQDQQKNMQKSMVVIASADGDVWLEKILQVPVESSFHWEKQPVLDQLEQLQTEFPASGVIVTQKQDVTFIDTALGEIRDEKLFSWDFENEDWVDYDNLSSPPSAADTNSDDFQLRFEENMQRWYKQLAPVLTKEMKKRHLDGAYIVGSKEMVNELTQHMNEKHIQGTVMKNLGSKPSHEILNFIYEESVR